MAKQHKSSDELSELGAWLFTAFFSIGVGIGLLAATQRQEQSKSLSPQAVLRKNENEPETEILKLTKMSNPELKRLLKELVADEDYEVAALVRDELALRTPAL